MAPRHYKVVTITKCHVCRRVVRVVWSFQPHSNHIACTSKCSVKCSQYKPALFSAFIVVIYINLLPILRNLFSMLNYIFHVISELGQPHDSSPSHNLNSLLSSFHYKQLTRYANKNMQLLTMLNKVRGHFYVAFRAGVHERSLPILVLHLCISTCSECNATDDTTRHPLHVHCYSYEEDLKRHCSFNSQSVYYPL